MTTSGEIEQKVVDELTERLIKAAEALHVRDIDSIGAYQGTAIAVSDMVRELDLRLSAGGPWPTRWKSNAVTTPEERHIAKAEYAAMLPFRMQKIADDLNERLAGVLPDEATAARWRQTEQAYMKLMEELHYLAQATRERESEGQP